jgi:hypothetical protein
MRRSHPVIEPAMEPGGGEHQFNVMYKNVADLGQFLETGLLMEGVDLESHPFISRAGICQPF